MKAALLSLFLVLMSSPALAQETGDIFVSVAGGGSGRIHIDGFDTGNEAPATLQDVEAGAHKVQVFGKCTSGSQTVEVVPGRISRAELMLQPGSGFMEIQVEPEVAEILVDGAPLGTGPTLATEMACGPHILQFESIGFLTKTRPIEVRMGGVHRIEIKLEAKGGRGSLSAVVDPVYSEIYIDEVLVATGPTTLDDIEAGTHQLVVLADGHSRHTQEVTVVTNETTRIDVKLTPLQSAEPEPPAPEPQAAAPQAPTSPQTATPLPPALEPRVVRNPTLRRISAAGLGVGGVALGFQSFFWWQNAQEAYGEYEAAILDERQQAAEVYYENVVMPAYIKSIGFAVGGGVAVISGISLGLNNPGQPVVGFSGTW